MLTHTITIIQTLQDPVLRKEVFHPLGTWLARVGLLLFVLLFGWVAITASVVKTVGKAAPVAMKAAATIAAAGTAAENYAPLIAVIACLLAAIGAKRGLPMQGLMARRLLPVVLAWLAVIVLYLSLLCWFTIFGGNPVVLLRYTNWGEWLFLVPQFIAFSWLGLGLGLITGSYRSVIGLAGFFLLLTLGTWLEPALEQWLPLPNPYLSTGTSEYAFGFIALLGFLLYYGFAAGKAGKSILIASPLLFLILTGHFGIGATLRHFNSPPFKPAQCIAYLKETGEPVAVNDYVYILLYSPDKHGFTGELYYTQLHLFQNQLWKQGFNAYLATEAKAGRVQQFRQDINFGFMLPQLVNDPVFTRLVYGCTSGRQSLGADLYNAYPHHLLIKGNRVLASWSGGIDNTQRTDSLLAHYVNHLPRKQVLHQYGTGRFVKF